MKKYISVYLKAGKNAATSYYRFYQFFDCIHEEFVYHLMIPDRLWGSFFPISKQRIYKKLLIFLFIYIRVFMNLLSDAINVPRCIIISRCLINRVMPISFKFLLLIAKKRGAMVIFDYDDQIIISNEVTQKSFNFFTDISDIIAAGSPYLIDLIGSNNSGKALFLPTTDGDIYKLISKDITERRIISLDHQVNVVWVGTFSGLKFLNNIMPAFEELGSIFNKEKKKLVLKVICDYPLEYSPRSFTLANIKWTRKKAIDAMLEAHIGIMPLEDNESTRGKCSFKLIQYLSAGLPIIGTNIGMNKMVLQESVGIGLEDNNTSEWVQALLKITKDKKTWLNYSKNSVLLWNDRFSYNSNLEKWRMIFSHCPMG